MVTGAGWKPVEREKRLAGSTPAPSAETTGTANDSLPGIRADYDGSTIVVYQAFNDAIADAAVREQCFAEPFSRNRMTWIKPSFLWLMERSGWATKSNQTRILAVRMTRAGWDRALSLGVLTSFSSGVHASIDAGRTEFASCAVHIQWDPERSIRGGKLQHRAIQVGISRTMIDEYVDQWTEQIADVTPLVKKLRSMRQAGKHSAAKRMLPPERVYPVSAKTGQRLGIDEDGGV